MSFHNVFLYGLFFTCHFLIQGFHDLIDSRSYTAVMKYLNMNNLHDEFYEVRKPWIHDRLSRQSFFETSSSEEKVYAHS